MEEKVEKSESARVRMNFWMSKNMFTFLEDISSRDGRSMSDVVREAVRDYMIKYKSNPIEKDEDGN